MSTRIAGLTVATALAVAASSLLTGGVAAASPADATTRARSTVMLALVSFNQYTSDTSDPGFALDPATHAYRRTQYTVLPSPDGQFGYAVDVDKGEFAIASYADAVHGTNLDWRDFEGETVEVPGDPFPQFQGPTVFWAAEGHTLIKANQFEATTTYLDAATGVAEVVNWPAALARDAASVATFGAVRGDRVSVRSFEKFDKQGVGIVTTWLIDRQGRLVRDSEVRIGPDAFWFDEGTDSVSPDGRYLIPGPGVILDTVKHRSRSFLDSQRQSGPSAGFVVGWSDDSHFMQTSRGENGRPITLSEFDTRGRIVKSLPLTMLPLADDGRTDARLIPVSPQTRGAVTFTG